MDFLANDFARKRKISDRFPGRQAKSPLPGTALGKLDLHPTNARDTKLGSPLPKEGRPQEGDGNVAGPYYAFPHPPGRTVLVESPLVQTPPIIAHKYSSADLCHLGHVFGL
jgi:hypothetical protein